MDEFRDTTSAETFWRVVISIAIGIVVVAIIGLAVVMLDGCSFPGEPAVVPLNNEPCPPKRRCLFDSTGAVIAVVPLAQSDTCECGDPIR